MEANTGPVPRPPTKEDALCKICGDKKRPVDLTKACIIWRNGAVAHVDCYNQARLAPNGRPARQREIGRAS